MKLVIVELDAVVEQKITTGTQNVHLAHIRPHIYKHNSPAGLLKVQVLDSNKKLIAESNTIAISAISAVAYFHGYIRFDVNVALKASTSYYIRLASTGYTFSESNYVGWAGDYDLRKYSCDYSPNAGLSNSLDMELWGRRKYSKG